MDVTSAASFDAFAGSVGEIDVLVHNAAAYVDWSETASGADLDPARAVVEANLFGAWRLTQALLPAIRRGHGRIVFVSSGAGSHADTAFGLPARGGAAASYGISKAAVNALTTTLAAEPTGSAVLVNAVCPGLTATDPARRAWAHDPSPTALQASCGQPPCPTTAPPAASSGTAGHSSGDGPDTVNGRSANAGNQSAHRAQMSGSAFVAPLPT